LSDLFDINESQERFEIGLNKSSNQNDVNLSHRRGPHD
jgi:hypothetical protein